MIKSQVIAIPNRATGIIARVIEEGAIADVGRPITHIDGATGSIAVEISLVVGKSATVDVEFTAIESNPCTSISLIILYRSIVQVDGRIIDIDRCTILEPGSTGFFQGQI